MLDVLADHFDGLDVKEIVTELFEEVTRSESSNEVGETSKKVGVSRRGIEIVTQGEVEERNSERIPQNTRKWTAWQTRVWDEWKRRAYDINKGHIRNESSFVPRFRISHRRR